MAWKAKFDSELDLKRQKGKDDITNKKLTGTKYILFIQNCLQ